MKPSVFDIASHSTRNPEKANNGDYCSWEILEEDQQLLAVLSDGVGSSPCDWKASKLACTQFINQFKKHTNIADLLLRIEAALVKTNKEILLEPEPCSGMKSTLSLLVWDLNVESCFFVNIGDSRIYEYKGHILSQISQDETKSVILKNKDGKPMIISGTAVVAEGITNAMGSHELSISVQSKPVKSSKGFLLSSDGFHNCKNSFVKDATKIFGALDMQKALDELQISYRDAQKDDMTLLAVRLYNQTSNSKNIIKAILDKTDTSQWDKLEITKAILEEMEVSIRERNEQNAKILLNYCDDHYIDLGRENLGNLASLIVQTDFQAGEIYRDILNKMRLSRH